MYVVAKHTFAGFQDKRHTFPSRIVNPERRSSEGRTGRVGRYRLVIKVSGLSVGSNILSQERIFRFHGRDASKHFHLNERMDEIMLSADQIIRQTFSSRMSSASNDTGRSIVRILSTCIRSVFPYDKPPNEVSLR